MSAVNINSLPIIHEEEYRGFTITVRQTGRFYFARTPGMPLYLTETIFSYNSVKQAVRAGKRNIDAGRNL